MILTGDVNVSGNLSIGGTLTYEDVTSIDSVGLITARSGLRITGGGLNVVGVSTFLESSITAPDIITAGAGVA